MTSKQMRKICQAAEALKALLKAGYELPRAEGMVFMDYRLSKREIEIVRESNANNGFFTPK